MRWCVNDFRWAQLVYCPFIVDLLHVAAIADIKDTNTLMSWPKLVCRPASTETYHASVLEAVGEGLEHEGIQLEDVCLFKGIPDLPAVPESGDLSRWLVRGIRRAAPAHGVPQRQSVWRAAPTHGTNDQVSTGPNHPFQDRRQPFLFVFICRLTRSTVAWFGCLEPADTSEAP